MSSFVPLPNAQLVVVTAAITGALTVPSQSAAIPVTPSQIIDSAVAASEAGAAVLHIHVRDPETGRPGGNVELFGEVINGIRDRCLAIIEPTTGGGPGQTMDERAAAVARFHPELASFNTGSLNIAVFLLADGPTSDTLIPWERDYLSATRDYVFKNTFADMATLSLIMREAGTKPSFEVFEIGHLHSIKYLIDAGFVGGHPHINFTLGVMGGMPARTDHFMHMVSTARALFGADFTFTTVGVGYPAQFDMAAMSILHGGHVRVGLEDSLWLSNAVKADSNAQLVEKAVALLAVLERRAASPQEARAILGLPQQGQEKSDVSADPSGRVAPGQDAIEVRADRAP
jgi:uncharacterized protein (DUF849 family)